jgi:hypothetical protein
MESIFSEPAPQIKALVRNLSGFTTLFAPGKSWDNVRSSAAPYTESRLTRSVANESVGFPVVEHLFFNIQPESIYGSDIFLPFYTPPQSSSSKKVCKKINFRSGNIRAGGQR